MIDRWGNSVRVGWAAHEILWLEAAMSLPVLDRPAAYKDISELTGRSLDAIRFKANALRMAAIKADREAARAPRMRLPISLPPSSLKPPTRAQLMGGR